MRKAVIYAAGRGLRLGAGYEGSHKTLLSFGGKTLLEWHTQHLSSLGIDELVVVTGHCAGLVEQELERIATDHSISSISISTLHNPDYLEGSVVSFEVSIPAIEAAREPVLLMDGDVLYARTLLARLVASAAPSVLLIDRVYSSADDDPVLVPIIDGRPVDFRKKWHGKADAVGESVGFFKVGTDDLPLLIERTRARCRGGTRRDSYDDVLRDLVVAGRFDFEDVTGLPWTEIDFPHDVERATREVLPAILASADTSDRS